MPEIPVDDCPTTQKPAGGSWGGAPTTTTTVKPAEQSWDTPARIHMNKNIVAGPVNGGIAQKNPNEVEVLRPTKQSSVEDLGEKQPPSVNIEIHNIFSFGAENRNNILKNFTQGLDSETSKQKETAR